MKNHWSPLVNILRWTRPWIFTVVLAGCSIQPSIEKELAFSGPTRSDHSSAAPEATPPRAPVRNLGYAPPLPSSEPYPIDLPSALRLARAKNHQIALARERISEAVARVDQAQFLLLPSIAAGASYYRHDGVLQSTGGGVQDVDRTSAYVGLGAGAVGAGIVPVPGVSLTIDLADAIFEPLVARQNRLATEASSDAVTNNVLLEVTIGYQELVRAKAALAIAAETHENAMHLARVTRDFARVGEGLESDAERAVVEQLVREREREDAWEKFQVRSALLVELLHMDGKVVLEPVDTVVIPIPMVPEDQDLDGLFLTAFQNRPEVVRNEALVKMASNQLRQVKYGPLIPNLSLALSSGNFAGSTGSSAGSFDDRVDYGAVVYWQLDNLGLGDWARTRQRRSRYEQARIVQKSVHDQVISEVRQAHAQVQSRRRQISMAEQAVTHAVRSLELNRARIDQKQGLPIEVLQAIQSLATTRNLYLDTVIGFNQAQIRLHTAVGQPVLAAPPPSAVTDLEPPANS